MDALTRVAAVIKRGPLAPLYAPARTLVLAASRVKVRVMRAIARAIAAPLVLLPKSVQASVRHEFSPVARLDYAPQRILLHIDSVGTLYRTGACRKEPETIRWIEEHVKPGDVFYDVGANVGAYSLVAAKHGHGDVRVLAFEPSFGTYAALCRNVIVNGCEASITPYPFCLSAAPGRIAFAHSSLEPGSALHLASADGAKETVASVYRQEMLALSVDALVTQFGFPVPSHLKIDVDGTELDVLRGAAGTLRSDRVRSLQVEVSPREPSAAEVVRLLSESGFRLVSQAARGGGDRWSNYLFVRP